MFARIYRKATKLAAAAFLRVLVKTVPYKIHTILTDNGVHRRVGWMPHRMAEHPTFPVARR